MSRKGKGLSPEISGITEIKRRKARKWLFKINTKPPPTQQLKQKEGNYCLKVLRFFPPLFALITIVSKDEHGDLH